MRAAALAAISLTAGVSSADDKPIRIGIIGLDTSHVSAFTNLLHGPKAIGDLAGFRVVAAFPGGSEDIPSSKNRVAGYTAELRDKHNVEIVASRDGIISDLNATPGHPVVNGHLICIIAADK